MGVSTFKRSSIILGKDGAGKNFKAFGITSGSYLEWDKDTDTLSIVNGNFAVGGDIEIDGDLTLTTEDISVVQGRKIFLDGQDGGEWISSDAAGDLMLNATTNLNLAIGGTDVVTAVAASVTFAQKIIQDDETEATASAGSIQTDGGLSVAKKAYIGTELVLVAGPLDMATAAEDIEIKANTIAALEIKGAANLLVFDTRSAITGVTGFAFVVPDIGFASATGSTRVGVSIDPGTLTFTGTATVTAMEGLGLYISAHTFAGTAATVTDASTLYIAAAPTSGGSVTVTNGYALKIAAGNMLTAGRIIIDDTTNSTTIGTGSIQTDGGMGVTLNSYFGGTINMADDQALTLGTTVANAATRVRLEFDETTSGIGLIQIGDLSNSQVLNENPGALVVPMSVVVTHSAGAGDCDDYVGIYTKFTISGVGDTGLTAVPLAARLYVNAPISQAYAFQNKAWKQSTDDIIAMAVSSVSLMIENAFEATQTLNVAEFFLDSDEARTVTCTSENFNMVLIKNNGNIAGLNSLLKLVSAGADSPGSIIHIEGATDNGFIQFDTGSDCAADASGVAGNRTHKIKCRLNSTTFYLNGYAA